MRQKLLWSTSGGDVTLTADEADQVLAILEAALEFCGSKADEVDESEDDTLTALADALRTAGETLGE